MKTLVAYFSAENGRTKNLAKSMAKVINADLYEITPQKPYSSSDLNYRNPLARCNREFIAKKTVAVVGKVENFEQYDKILIGFPIWYGGAPNVVKTFCNDYDFSGKTVAVFATSGGSGIGKTAEKLQPFIKGTKIIKATLMNQTEQNFLKEWAEN